MWTTPYEVSMLFRRVMVTNSLLIFERNGARRLPELVVVVLQTTSYQSLR